MSELAVSRMFISMRGSILCFKIVLVPDTEIKELVMLETADELHNTLFGRPFPNISLLDTTILTHHHYHLIWFPPLNNPVEISLIPQPH